MEGVGEEGVAKPKGRTVWGCRGGCGRGLRHREAATLRPQMLDTAHVRAGLRPGPQLPKCAEGGREEWL